MRTADVLSAGLWAVVGAYFIYAGWDLGLGKLRDPGSGFMIFWVGIIAVALSLSVMAVALRTRAGERLRSLWADTDYRRLVRAVIALVVYAVLLPNIGFIPSTVLLMIVLFRTIDPPRWWVTLVLAIGATLFCDLVFRRWLGVQLPLGPFGWG